MFCVEGYGERCGEVLDTGNMYVPGNISWMLGRETREGDGDLDMTRRNGTDD